MTAKSKLTAVDANQRQVVDGHGRTHTIAELALAADLAPDDLVFLSGSRLEGFGNNRSDYDLYVVRASSQPGPSPITVVLEHNYVVYESFSHAGAMRSIDHINALSTTDHAAVWALSFFELEFYYRVLIGQGIVNDAAFEALRERCRKPVIDGAVRAWFGLRAMIHLEEAERRLAEGHEAGACQAAEYAVGSAVDAYLAGRGESYPSPKWRFEKLVRLGIAPDEIGRSAWALKALGEQPLDWYLSEIRRFYTALDLNEFLSWRLNNLVYAKSRSVCLREVRGASYLIENKRTVFELQGGAAVIWQWIDGRTSRGALIARAVASGTVAESDAAALLSTLSDHGLIK